MQMQKGVFKVYQLQRRILKLYVLLVIKLTNSLVAPVLINFQILPSSILIEIVLSEINQTYLDMRFKELWITTP